MNNQDFIQNLIYSCREIGFDVQCNNVNFLIYPIYEQDKKYSSKDDIMRLHILSQKNIEGREISFQEVCKIFTSFEGFYPLWIKISRRSDRLAELKTSLRFRKVTKEKKSIKFYPFIIEN